MPPSFSRQIVIRNPYPSLDSGDVPVKVQQGSTVRVYADIFIHGNELLDARLRYRKKRDRRWKFSPMTKGDNDRWEGRFRAGAPGEHEYTVQAWVDGYSGLIRNIRKWYDSGEDISQDFHAVEDLAYSILRKARKNEKMIIRSMISLYEEYSVEDAITLAESSDVIDIFRKYQPKTKLRTYAPSVKVRSVPKYGGFSSWYEIFPRSQSPEPDRSGTLRDCEKTVEYARSMGFDVLYLTPVHPIGGTSRRGRNGALVSDKGDPGSPWAIGNAYGGHKSVNPELGTLEDFRNLVSYARDRGVEIALDIAFQCSPDHPYVSQHPEWFYHRPDGSIRYAENPPKKYYDIYPLNFDNPDWRGLWNELKSIFVFWIKQGVRVFRVDNPHTKPFDFWKTVLGELSRKYPDVIFLSEAFTRPKVMYELSRIGFTCSYSYFTWKNYDWEIKSYFSEISGGEEKLHYRPVLFTNTPDILTEVLQSAGKPAFTMRAVLAATLSPMWGIYSGYEMCENQAVPGTEEYMNSEKYEVKHRNPGKSGNIKGLIRELNRVRLENRNLQTFANIEFLDTDNNNIVAYLRWEDDPSDPLVVVVNINPYENHEASVKIPLWKLGMEEDEEIRVNDVLRKEEFRWRGEWNNVVLETGEKCARIFRIER